MLNLLTGKTTRVLFLAFFAALISTTMGFAAPPNTMPINRAQIRFVTANVSDAGSDDYVKVYLNGDNKTWVESYADDFKQGSTITYDLRLDYVARLSDLDYLRVEKTGDDGWCVKQLFLIVNGRTIYSKTFSGNGLWLDNSGGQSRAFYINDTEMRTTADWTNFVSPFRPAVIPASDVRSRMESAFGDFIAYDYLLDNDGDMLMQKDDSDGGYGIDFYPINPNTWRVDLDAEYDDPTWWNHQIDVDFDLKVICANGRVVFSTANISPTDNYGTAPTGRMQNFARYTMASRLNEMMKNFTAYGNNCYYMNVYLSSNGDLNVKEQNVPVFARGLENSSPINIQTPSLFEVAPYEQTSFTAAVGNESPTDTEAEISFDLSAGIMPLDAVIEAKEGEKTRQITVKEVVRQPDGSSRIIFRDRLRAGKNADYTLRLMFQSQEDRKEQIITRAQIVNQENAVEASSVEAATAFTFSSGKIRLP